MPAPDHPETPADQPQTFPLYHTATPAEWKAFRWAARRARRPDGRQKSVAEWATDQMRRAIAALPPRE